ncbi:Gfo/Idh/MocA family oxidoreductase [Actinoplanes sp. KI2]|uniref:Gfo/Idh/MocA family protein n=1 Tax=Actinoplanes sp. KI2 TaxID=2983315 RepID=UPI0021D5F8E2|nr:Gfo/Idh/MocA family oxidoreductase [Actinoplanes sp. KI2]MCU7730702.1 Gfo/Idh/MocA family oxidoreductase [Actinoplanes sp. KI2]
MTVTIGLVGAGRRAAQVHAPTLAGSPDVCFVGVWAPTPGPVRELADRHHVRPFDRFADLLDHCDAVAFAVPPPVQAELAAAAARRGKSVFLERPVAGDIAGAEELVEAVQRSKVVSQIGLAWRYSAEVRRFLSVEVARIKPDGGAGRLVSGSHRPGGSVSAWRVERGVLRGQGVDLLDLLDALLGPIVGVQVHGDRQGWVGLMLDHQVGRFSEASMSAMAAPETFRADVEIFGPGGGAALDCTRVSGPHVYRTMYREFADAIRSGGAPALDARHGLHLQRVIESADTDILLGT